MDGPSICQVRSDVTSFRVVFVVVLLFIKVLCSTIRFQCDTTNITGRNMRYFVQAHPRAVVVRLQSNRIVGRRHISHFISFCNVTLQIDTCVISFKHIHAPSSFDCKATASLIDGDVVTESVPTPVAQALPYSLTREWPQLREPYVVQL
jgi:hypothetical protein